MMDEHVLYIIVSATVPVLFAGRLQRKAFHGLSCSGECRHYFELKTVSNPLVRLTITYARYRYY